MLKLLYKLSSLLSRRDKWICVIFIFMMVFNAFLEMVGISLIMPVIALLSKPELIQQNKYLLYIYNFIAPSSNSSFLKILCLMLIGVYVFKNAFTMFLMWLQGKFIYNKATQLGKGLYSNYMKTSYTFHLNNNPSHLLYNLTTALPSMSAAILMPLIIITSECFVVTIILIMLTFIAPAIIIPLSFLSALTGWIAYQIIKRYIYKLGKSRLKEGKLTGQTALQGLKAIKETKVLNVENAISNNFNRHQSALNKIVAKIYFLNQFPRCFIESFVVVVGLSILLILLMFDKASGEITLTLSLLGVSFIRLMPSMTRIQYNLNTIKHSHFAFDEIYHDIVNLKPEVKNEDNEPIIFDKKISIENISFKYPESEDLVLDKFGLQIEKNSAVAIVGKTGCGKTTLVDIILGLLKPKTGSIAVDGINIENNLASWQKQIGYVPQYIYLTDDTIRANVAFGIEANAVDNARVEECLKTAQVWDFIDSLPENLNSITGDNGVRLSGGQRQRIGIARALYHNPNILILDEATSSLDNETETAFIDAINALKGKVTIIMIAHRLSTVENCDDIVKLK